jgi:two-component system phosphate regulon sensor histidine kinase PhoR
LDLGQLASGNFSVDLSKEIDVRDAVKRAVRMNYDYALKRRIQLKVEIDEDVRLINLDAKRIKQVLTNLISNAVKYSSQGSEVQIIGKNNSEFLEILVMDQGFGMKPEEVATAFEKYKTIENPNSGTVDSFGLGLPITKHLVEIQNGSLEVKSEINKGTEIKLRFPYSM